jgi:hypothetical protein
VTLLLHTALRLHELVALDVDDVSISARKGPFVSNGAILSGLR